MSALVTKTAIGDEVKRLRTDLGLTQAEVADRMGMSASSVGVIETGTTARPPDPCLKRLADALDTSFGHLLDLIPDTLKAATTLDERTQMSRYEKFVKQKRGELFGIALQAFDAVVELLEIFKAEHAGRLGDWLRARREELGLTLEEVAEQLPITASTLGQIERGEILRPPDDVLAALASALDTTVEQLMGLIPQELQSLHDAVSDLAENQLEITKKLADLLKS